MRIISWLELFSADMMEEEGMFTIWACIKTIDVRA
jgi:hypothetical protein